MSIVGRATAVDQIMNEIEDSGSFLPASQEDITIRGVLGQYHGALHDRWEHVVGSISSGVAALVAVAAEPSLQDAHVVQVQDHHDVDVSLGIGYLAVVLLNGPALKAIRERSGLTQSDLSRMTGVSQGRISELEADDPVNVRPGTVKALADALSVPTVALLGQPAESGSAA